MQNSNPTPLKTQIGKIDEGYFAGYSKSDIHIEMLDDQVRVE
jgi:hypothetical protein